MGDQLKKHMYGAVTWSSVNIFGIQAIQLLVGIFLARILMPEEFGMVGVLFIFTGITTVLVEGGFAHALVRKNNAGSSEFSTVFYFNFLISILMYAILYMASPAISRFFFIPELTEIARILFLVVLLYPFYLTQQAMLLKALDYKSIAVVNIISVALSGIIATYLALKGFGAWSLVVQQLAFHSFKIILFPFFLRWKPQLIFSLSTIKELSGFAIPLSLQTLLNVIFAQLYIIIIGRFYPIQQVGYYTQANKYSEALNAATQNILSSSIFPILSKIQEQKERLLRIYRKLTGAVALITFPVTLFLVMTSEPIIILLITDKWQTSVILLQLLLIAHIFTPLYTVNINLLNAKGESKTTLYLETGKKIIILISVLVTIKLGIKQLLIAFAIANSISYFASMLIIKKSISHRFRNQMTDIIPILLFAIFALAVPYLLHYLQLSNLLQLLIQFLAYILIYLLGLRLLFSVHLKSLLEFIRQPNKQDDGE